jgi:hypothetical protein
MPVYDRFEPVLRAALPAGGWALGPNTENAVRVLRLHGVRVEHLDSAADVQAEVFRVDSVARAPRPFQGHYEERFEGQWRSERRRVELGGYFIPAAQPLALVAQELLEPQSDDGIGAWNGFDPGLRVGGDFPVLRVTAVPNGKRTAVP